MRKGYIYTNRKQSTTGIMSTFFGMAAFISYILCVVNSYKLAGEGVERYAVCALLATVFMIAGFVLAIFSFLETDRFKLFTILGIVSNVLALLSLSAILYAGAFVI